jgi:predicted PurR-regulated permease PerM
MVDRQFWGFSRWRPILPIAFFALVLLVLYRQMLVPFGVSLFFSYLLLPIIDGLEKRKIPRWASASAVIVFLLGVVAIVLVYLLPGVAQEIIDLIELIPGIVSGFNRSTLPWVEQFLVRNGIVESESFREAVRSFNLAGELSGYIQSGVANVLDTASIVAGGLTDIALIPLLVFFILRDFPTIRQLRSKWLPVIFTGDKRLALLNLESTMRAVLKGQVLVALTLMVLYVVGFQVIGVPSGFAIAMVSGVARLIPYMDVLVGGALCLIVVLAKAPSMEMLVWIVMLFAIVQALDGMFITPKILGKSAGLHPAVVICSVLAFGKGFGFWGVVLAIPGIVILKSIVIHAAPLIFEQLKTQELVLEKGNKSGVYRRNVLHHRRRRNYG